MSGVHFRPNSCGPQGGGGCGEGGKSEEAKGKSGEHCPPGLEKKGGLPPGQAKKCGGEDGWDGEGDFEGHHVEYNEEDGHLRYQFDSQDGNSQGGSPPASSSGLGDYWNRATDWLAGVFNGSGQSNPIAAAAGQKPADNGTLVNAPPSSSGLPNISGTASGKAKDLPFISQYDPVGKDSSYLNGPENCGPAVLAMIAKSRGQTGGMTDAQLVTSLMKPAGTTADGTSGNGMIAGLESLGMKTGASAGADMNWINSQLAQGHSVISNGDFYSIPTHYDQNLLAGHYIAVTGVNNGIYTVVDPADANMHSMTAQQLQNFINAHPDGGFSISAW